MHYPSEAEAAVNEQINGTSRVLALLDGMPGAVHTSHTLCKPCAGTSCHGCSAQLPRDASVRPARLTPLHPFLPAVEYNISYIYHSMSAYFDRDNVSLPGLAKYFRDESGDERDHAQLLIDFQNARGGRVALQAILPPELEFNDAHKGDALYAMELALSLERLNYDKLLHLWEVLDRHSDAQATHFVESM